MTICRICKPRGVGTPCFTMFSQFPLASAPAAVSVNPQRGHVFWRLWSAAGAATNTAFNDVLQSGGPKSRVCRKSGLDLGVGLEIRKCPETGLRIGFPGV